MPRLFPSALTRHDRALSIAAMATGATLITLLETTIASSESHDNNTSTHKEKSNPTPPAVSDFWYITFLLAGFLLSCSGFALLLLDYRRSGRPVAKPARIVCECGTGALGFAMFFFGSKSHVKLPLMFWVWACVAGGIVWWDRRGCVMEREREGQCGCEGEGGCGGGHDTVQC